MLRWISLCSSMSISTVLPAIGEKFKNVVSPPLELGDIIDCVIDSVMNEVTCACNTMIVIVFKLG